MGKTTKQASPTKDDPFQV
jgi:hypothetical protein